MREGGGRGRREREDGEGMEREGMEREGDERKGDKVIKVIIRSNCFTRQSLAEK